MSQIRLLIMIAIASAFSQRINANMVAVIDSGTDIKHEALVNYVWHNPIDDTVNDRDEDRNGYPDDIYGWNFAESNNEVIDYSYLGTFNEDVRKFFVIQGRMIRGEAQEYELAWLKTQVKDPEFLKRLQIYGNFMHGTHVSGIATRDAAGAKMLSVKLIPTEIKLPKINKADEGLGTYFMKQGLAQVAKMQCDRFEEIASYIAFQGARVANGSFGTGYPQAVAMVKSLYKSVLRRDPEESELKEVIDYFFDSLMREGQRMLLAAPQTLFVFAAGNDGLNNDEFGSSPTNLRGDNVISVAATMSDVDIAPFSNFGKEMVDVAAPGVDINSSVPGDLYLGVSGTSQAAPYVSNIALKMVLANPNLMPKDLKHIIMETVDPRDYLEGKVKTGGIVNSERAVKAAEFALFYPMELAIEKARDVILPLEKDFSGVAKSQYFPGLVLPLTPMFKL